MVEYSESDEGVTRESVLALINRKDNLEKEISELKEILDINHVGMEEPLVDEEGFPREDIDVYLVRHTRHKIICLKNDHKALMRQIERGLHIIHANAEFDQDDSPMLENAYDSVPFAKVDLVHPGSPAALCGLEVGDIIIKFGTVHGGNFSSLRDIGAVVENSVGQKVAITVLRGDAPLRLFLTPKQWSGRGLLGCNVLPIDSVDR